MDPNYLFTNILNRPKPIVKLYYSLQDCRNEKKCFVVQDGYLIKKKKEKFNATCIGKW